MSYEPRGKMIGLIAAMRARLDHIFTADEVAQLLECKPYPSVIGQYISTATASAAIFRINVRGEWLYAGREITDDMLLAAGRAPRDKSGGLTLVASPFDEKDRARATADPRAPGPAGFVPRSMNAPRPGSDIRVPKFSGAAAVAALDRHDTPRLDLVQQSEELDAEIRAANERINTGRNLVAAAKASGGSAHQPEVSDEEVEAAAEESADLDEDIEFNAAVWLDGEMVIYGAQANEDGSFTLTAEQVTKLRPLFGVEVLQ